MSTLRAAAGDSTSGTAWHTRSLREMAEQAPLGESCDATTVACRPTDMNRHGGWCCSAGGDDGVPTPSSAGWTAAW